MRKMVELRNDFHNSRARTFEGRLSSRTVARVRQALCGIKGCTCSGALGQRGPQKVDIEVVYERSGPTFSVWALH